MEMALEQRIPLVDVRAARTSQATTAALVLLAFLVGRWPLLLLPALHLAASFALGRRGNLPVRAFDAWLRPRLGPGALEDARPPRFANFVGVVFLAAALIAHALGLSTLGWGLALIVGGLALLAFGADAMLRGPDCAGLTPEECALKRDIAASFGRQQVRAGGALALMGLAVFMLARPRLTRANPDDTQR